MSVRKSRVAWRQTAQSDRYQFNEPIRVKGGKMVKVTGVSLYTSFKENRGDALEAVKSGTETLMQEAREIDIEI
jgi:hypothetical protein